MKKKFFLGLAVLLSVSLFLTGCGDPADGLPGQSGQNGQDGLPPNENFSQSVSVTALRDAIANLGAGATLRLDNVIVTGGGTVDFGPFKVRVIGALATDADGSTGVAVLNLAAADVTFVDGAKVALGHADDVALLTAAQLANKGTVGKYAEKVNGPADFENVTGDVTAVETLELTAGGETYPANLTIYVYRTLAVKDGRWLRLSAGPGRLSRSVRWNWKTEPLA
jgi:hypothetical protein